MPTKLQSFVGACCGILSAAILGGLAAVCAIAFFEGAQAIHDYFNLSSPSAPSFSLFLLPLCAGVLCGLLRMCMHGHFLGLSDTMWGAASGARQKTREALLSILASFTAFSGGASVGQYGPVAHLGGFIGEWFRGRWWWKWLAPHDVKSDSDSKSDSNSVRLEDSDSDINPNSNFDSARLKNPNSNFTNSANLTAQLNTTMQVGWARGVGAACGVAAAIAAAFNAPVTGLLFAHEVVLRHYSVRAFAPVAVSAVVGYMVSVSFSRPSFLSIGEMQTISFGDAALFVVQGALFGLLSAWYLRAIFALWRKLSPLPVLPLLTAIGGVCGLLWLLSPQSASGTRELLHTAIAGDITVWQVALLVGGIKMIATILCLGAGFAGGIVSPTLVVGAMAGWIYASVVTALGFYTGPTFVLVVCGMMAFVAPALGAPLASILFVLELSGGNYPLTLAAALAVALSASAAAKVGRGSYYEQQLKSRDIDIRHAAEWRAWHNITMAAVLKDMQPQVFINVLANQSVSEIVLQHKTSEEPQKYIKDTTPIFVTDAQGTCLGELDRVRALQKIMQQNDENNQGRTLVCADLLKPTTMILADSTLNEVMHMQQLTDNVGLLAVVDAHGKLLAAIREGDLWRMILARRTQHENSIDG